MSRTRHVGAGVPLSRLPRFDQPVEIVAEHVAICGENPTPIDADLVGCGKPIKRHEDVYRCTDCGVPFHRACAVRHFETDTPEHAAKVYEEQLRRLDAIDAALSPQQAEPGKGESKP